MLQSVTRPHEVCRLDAAHFGRLQCLSLVGGEIGGRQTLRRGARGVRNVRPLVRELAQKRLDQHETGHIRQRSHQDERNGEGHTDVAELLGHGDPELLEVVRAEQRQQYHHQGH
jgi:hypothetical protein